jgi:hypothetical protein
MKIILSRKGFDDKNGGHPSIIWPDDKRMLSFPIPVESSEVGVKADKMIFRGRNLSKIFSELGFKEEEIEKEFHLDPVIQNLTQDFTIGSLGQSGAALRHLQNNDIGKDDIFLFFGTFSETFFTQNKELRYNPMHAFHAIWGYLVVDDVIDNVSELPHLYFELKKHPHVDFHIIWTSIC